MRRFLLLLICMGLMGCGASHRADSTALGLSTPGEKAYLAEGDFDAAETALKEAFKSSPDAVTAFLLADLLDATGRPEEALENYFEAIALDHQKGSEPDASTAAAMGVTAVRDRVERFYEKFERFFARIDGQKRSLPMEAWYQLLTLRFGLKRARGEDSAAEAFALLACPNHWKAAGPVGPWVWSAFDDRNHALEHGDLPAEVALGPGRGTSALLDADGDTCFVTASNPAMPMGGVTFARTRISVSRETTVRMRLQTSLAATVRVGDVEVLRRETREKYNSKVLWTTVRIPSGESTLTVKLAGENSLPSFSLSLFDEAGRPAYDSILPTAVLNESTGVTSASFDGVLERPLDPQTGGLSRPARRFAQMKRALWWDDMARAREIYRELTRSVGDGSSALLMNMAELTGADPSMPADLAYESARPYLSRALDEEPRLWEARTGLADRELDEERVHESIALLEEGRRLCPEEVSILRRQASTFLSYGWAAEAEAAVAEIAQLLPTACSTLDWQLAVARRRSRFPEALKIAEKLATCDVFSESLMEERRRAVDLKGALAESERLQKLTPKSGYAALEVAKSALAAELGRESIEAWERAVRLAPSESGMTVGLSDALLASGDKRRATEVLQQGMHTMFATKTSLLEAQAALEGAPILADYRVDGDAVIDAYEKETVEYDAAAVYVLDRAVYLIGDLGDVTMLVHSIAHLKTDEAVESHGELSVPSGARLLRARTVKADGRILEPQEVTGKDTLSMPDLEPGDFVEYEYLLTTYPNQLFPGGFDTERFFFQDFETGFHRTEIVVVAPEAVQIEADPRGECPKMTEEKSGNMRVLTWKTRNASPHTKEPMAPAAVEYLPSIRVTAKASWDTLFRRIRDQLAEKNRIGYPIVAAAAEALLGIDKADHASRRRALYRWVTRNIEPSSDMFEEASHVIARKAGNRARAFEALLKAAGYSSRLALVMPSGEDETRNALPSVKQFYLLVVEVEDDGFIDLSNEYVPYGFLPGPMRNRPLRYVDSGALSATSGGVISRDTQAVQGKMWVAANGDASGQIREVLTGGLAGEWRAVLEKNKASDYHRLFQSTYISSAIPGAELVRLNIAGLKDPQAPLIFEYDVRVRGFAVPQGDGNLRVKLPFETNFSKQSGGLPARTVPLVLSLHVAKTVEMEITLPSGTRAVPPDAAEQSVSRVWGHASREIFADKSKLSMRFAIQVDVDRVAPEKYGDFLVFAKKIDRVSDVSFAINK